MDIDVGHTQYPFPQPANTVEERAHNEKDGLFGVSNEKDFIEMIVDQIKQEERNAADLAKKQAAKDLQNKHDTKTKTKSIIDETVSLNDSDKEDLIAGLEAALQNSENLTDTQRAEISAILSAIQSNTATLKDMFNLSELVATDKAFDIVQKDLQALIQSLDVAASKQKQATSPEQSQSLARQQAKEFKSYLEDLLAGIPQENRPDVRIIPQNILGDLQDGLNFTPTTQVAAPSLIATDLTPETLNQFLSDLQQQTSQGNSMIVGLVKLGPELDQNSAIYLPQVIVTPKGNGQQVQSLQQTIGQHLAATAQSGLTNEQIIANAAQATAKAAAEGAQQTNTTAAPQLNLNGSMESIAQQLNAIEVGAGDNMARPIDGEWQPLGRTARMTGMTTMPATSNGAANAAVTPNPAHGNSANTPLHMVLSTTQTGTAQNAAMLDALQGFGYTSVDAAYDAELFAAGQYNNLGMQQATSLVTQAHQAAQPHPATQVVAATISKAASNGETKNITVRLNPPEMGRVDVKLEFDGNNRVKATLIFEKQETFNMMQRDAHLLEKALQDSGLDANSSDLNFELAQDGQFFNDGGHDSTGYGNGNGEGADAQADEGEELIETGVNWHIDEATGLTRYDILV